MDTYCWIHSTFSVPSQDSKKNGMPHQGIGTLPGKSSSNLGI